MSLKPLTRAELEEAYCSSFQNAGFAADLEADEVYPRIAHCMESLGQNAAPIDNVIDWLVGDAPPTTAAAEASIRAVIGPACSHVPFIHERTEGYLAKLAGIMPADVGVEIEVRVKLGDKLVVKKLARATRTDLKRSVGEIAGIESLSQVRLKNRAEEIRKATERALASGIKVGGVPIGMKKSENGLVPDPQQFEAVEWMIRWKRQQIPIHGITTRANERGYRTPGGAAWQPGVVKKVIQASQVLDDVARSELSRRVKAAMAAKKKAGESTGVAPYGYRVDLHGRVVEDAREQEVIQTAKELRNKRRSYRGIIRELKDRGMLSRAGKPFTVQALYTMCGEYGD